MLRTALRPISSRLTVSARPTHNFTKMSFSRLVRFLPSGNSSSTPLIGEPVDPELDVGLATYDSKPVEVNVFSGKSVLKPGEKTGEKVTVGRLLSPLGKEEVGTIRCIGLNYTSHAKEMNLDLPSVPTVFYKPSSALSDPFPAPTIIPKHVQKDNCADYEAELVLVIGERAKNVKEEDALDYLLGYTVANDLSSRISQTNQSQWCYSKSFDTACPLGPVIIHKSQVEKISDLRIRSQLNGEVKQDCGLGDLIFSAPKLIAFLSQGTTLEPGTIILTGTPAGVGWSAKPRVTLKDGDEFRVFLSHGVGTLINKIEEEK